MVNGIARVLLVAVGAGLLLLAWQMQLSLASVVQGTIAVGLIWAGMSERTRVFQSSIGSRS